MIFSENRYTLFRIMLRSFVLTRFLPQISLRNLRKLDCYANRNPPRSKTLWDLNPRSPDTHIERARATMTDVGFLKADHERSKFRLT